jgi:hypothetical protein
MIAQAQNSRGKAVSQTNASKASNFAELGVNQYLNFLNSNRILLTYPSCVAPATNGTCPDAGTTKSWANVSNSGILNNIPSPPTGEVCAKSEVSENANQDSPTEISTVWANAAHWGDINGGQYKLISYAYTPKAGGAANTAPGEGRLIIEGRTNVPNTSSTDVSITAASRIAVTIPVTIAPTASPTPNGGFPGLWARDFKFNGTADVNTHVWDSHNCQTGTTAISATRVEPVPNNPLVVVRDTNNGNHDQYQLSANDGIITIKDQLFPDLPNQNVFTVPTGVTINNIACPYAGTANETFPRVGDKDKNGVAYGTAPANATYIYKVCKSTDKKSEGTSIDLGASINLGRSGQEQFIFYVEGNLKIGAKGNLVPVATGTTKTVFFVAPAGWLDIGSNGNLGLVTDPTAIQFYVYAKDSGTASSPTRNTTSVAQSVYLNGNGSFYGFIFAPFANAKVWGTGDVAGALWAKSYEGGGNGNMIQGIFGATRLEVEPTQGTPIPSLGQATKWEKVGGN